MKKKLSFREAMNVITGDTPSEFEIQLAKRELGLSREEYMAFRKQQKDLAWFSFWDTICDRVMIISTLATIFSSVCERQTGWFMLGTILFFVTAIKISREKGGRTDAKDSKR